MKKLLTIFLPIFFIVGCVEKSKIPSLKYGKNKFVSCFFNPISENKDLLLDVKFDKTNNTSNVVTLNPVKILNSQVLTYTPDRLALQIYTDTQPILVNFYFDTSTFDVKSGNNFDTGTCEEKVK